MDQEGVEGDEPDYHPEELEGQDGPMQLFIVPPNPAPAPDPPRGQKRGRSNKTPQQQPNEGQSQRQPRPATPTCRLNKLPVWQDFTKISKDGADVIIAKCNHCPAQLSGKYKWHISSS
jgi:hypothetical protein